MCFSYLGLATSSILSRRVTDPGLRSIETAEASKKDLVRRVNDLVESDGHFYLPLDEEEYPDPNQSPDYIDPDLFSSLDTSHTLNVQPIIMPDGTIYFENYLDRPVYILRCNSIFDRDVSKFRPSDLGLSLDDIPPRDGKGLHKQYREALFQRDFQEIWPRDLRYTHKFTDRNTIQFDLNWWYKVSEAKPGQEYFTINLSFDFRFFIWNGKGAAPLKDKDFRRSDIARLGSWNPEARLDCMYDRSEEVGMPVQAPFLASEVANRLKCGVGGQTISSSHPTGGDTTTTYSSIGDESVDRRDLVRSGFTPKIPRTHPFSLRLAELQTSPRGSTIKRDTEPQPCTGGRAQELHLTQKHTRALAEFTRLYPDQSLWNEYNNGPSDVKFDVGRVYRNVEDYGPTRINENDPDGPQWRTFNLKELCGLKLDTCSDENVLAYTDSRSEIVICDNFFSRRTPPLRKCDTPSKTNEDMVDRSGILLHELTHVFAINNNIGGIGVHDGKSSPIFNTE